MKKVCFGVLVLVMLSLAMVGCDGETIGRGVSQNQGQPTAQPTTAGATTVSSGPVLGVMTAVSSPVAEATDSPAVYTPVATNNADTPVLAATATPTPELGQVQPTSTAASSATTKAAQSATTKAAQNVPTTKASQSVSPSPARTSPASPTAKPSVVPTFAPVPTQPVTSYSGPLSEVVRGRTGKKEVAITLDAGADGRAFPKLGAALSQYNTHITFFLTGLWVQQNPTFTQQIVAGGHEIANHSWDHPDFMTLSDDKAHQEIEKADEMISRFTGHSPKPLWRFPYGSRNQHLLQLVNGMGYRSIFWTIDSLDSVGQPKSAQFLIDRVTKQTDAQLDGEIILMHVGNATTADALPVILQNLQSRGFKIVPVSELLS